MPLVMIDEYYLPQEATDVMSKEYFNGAEVWGLNDDSSEEEIQEYVDDFFAKNLISPLLIKRTRMIMTEHILSVSPVNPKECNFPEQLVPEEWKTEILYNDPSPLDDIPNDAYARIRTNESVQEINNKILEASSRLD